MQFIGIQILSNQEKEELLKQFKTIDINNDGQLSIEELVDGYYKMYGNKEKAQEIAKGIFEKVDSNHSGRIDFTEFVVAAINTDKLLSKQKIEKAFKMFDIVSFFSKGWQWFY